jgi:endonuclease/exonuclease/phosphatase family metal-dependent hydrolase
MKLITLNAWGGRVSEALNSFFKTKMAEGVDIFCLQEIFAGGKFVSSRDLVNFEARRLSLFEEISAILTDYNGFFCPVHDDVYGIACFVRKSIKVIETGSVILFENKKFPDALQPDLDHTRKMQWLKIKKGVAEYMIMNLHGYWTGVDKKDTPERIKQSQNIIDFVEKSKIPKILCGDFNLRPDTESIHLLEKHFKNLIVENNVTSTRTNLYKRSTEKYADYVFISPDVKIVNFKVLPDVCSDHTPLFLEFK